MLHLPPCREQLRFPTSGPGFGVVTGDRPPSSKPHLRVRSLGQIGRWSRPRPAHQTTGARHAARHDRTRTHGRATWPSGCAATATRWWATTRSATPPTSVRSTSWSAALDPPRVVWVMVPAGEPTTSTVDALAGLLGEGDIVVEGGNSRWTDARRPGRRPGREGDRVRRRRRLRRRLGPRQRLRPDGRRYRRRRRTGVADPADPRPARPRRHRQGAVPRRRGGGRALHQDGPQRHRVRRDAGTAPRATS